MKKIITLALFFCAFSLNAQKNDKSGEVFSMTKEELKQYVKDHPESKKVLMELYKDAFERAIKPMKVKLKGGALEVDGIWVMRLSSIAPEDALEINWDAFEFSCPEVIERDSVQEVVIKVLPRN